MNNTPSRANTNFSESPKTPGGISKSLLTPCRRVGLSRNWRKGSVSPFISPLSGGNADTNTQNEYRKRKTSDGREQSSNEKKDIHISLCDTLTSTSQGTPSRSLTARKRTKTLVLTNQDIEKEVQDELQVDTNNTKDNLNSLDISNSSKHLSEINSEQCSSIVPQVSKLKLKNKSHSKTNTSSKAVVIDDNSIDLLKLENVSANIKESNKNKSPNNLTKECMVVIQKKILKTKSPSEKVIEKYPSHYSDNEDIPLSNLSSKENIFKPNGNDDFVENKRSVKKLDKTTSITDLKVKSKNKGKMSHKKPRNVPVQTSQSSNSYDDDDDFITDKRTILIKKSYGKIVKPIKSKSTGSITRADIEELQARIEVKKNKLLAKAMTNETEELRNLIKKWQTGCQNALAELFELMKQKMPEQSLDYSEMLKMLKIPSDLVGYDSDNDCFVTPDDKDIILSGLNLNKI